MPQLDPVLWLAIFVLAWCTLLIFGAAIVVAYIYPDTPGEKKDTKKPGKNHWNWPWQ
nr:ATP synthase F0 subunit 8 [Centropomus undecimalis]